MPKQITISELVIALRSGKYKKGKGALRAKKLGESEFGFCCEGVACDLVGAEVIRIRKETYKYAELTFFSSMPGDDGNAGVDAFAPEYIWAGTGMETASSSGTHACMTLPVYSLDRISPWDDREVIPLRYDGDAQVTLASLNDYSPNDPKNEFTFDQIADLLEWYYL